VNALGTHNKSEEQQLAREKSTLLKVDIQLVGPQHQLDFSQLLHVLFCTLTVNQNIIKIYHHKRIDKELQNLIHHTHEGPQSVG
jgi:hypothetical protein